MKVFDNLMDFEEAGWDVRPFSTSSRSLSTATAMVVVMAIAVAVAMAIAAVRRWNPSYDCELAVPHPGRLWRPWWCQAYWWSALSSGHFLVRARY